MNKKMKREGRSRIEENKTKDVNINPFENFCRLEDQPIPGWSCGANRYFQATRIILLLMLTNALSVLGACPSLDARQGGSRLNENEVRRHWRKPYAWTR
ncbi:hypothetical protein TNCV_822871 [Trichonephila clavipes]|nr:hypothetical protein TNCV_822871 [Trichonephila clavipes]